MKTRYSGSSVLLGIGVLAFPHPYQNTLYMGWVTAARSSTDANGSLAKRGRALLSTARREDVPRVSRSAVKVFSVDGKLVAQAGEQDGEGPIHFALSPGDYVIASGDQWQWRRVQVEVKDGRDTVVTKAQLIPPRCLPPLASRLRPGGGPVMHALLCMSVRTKKSINDGSACLMLTSGGFSCGDQRG